MVRISFNDHRSRTDFGSAADRDNLFRTTSSKSLGTEGESLKDAFIQNGDFWIPDSGGVSSTSSQLPPIEGNPASIEDPFISQNDDSWLIGEDVSLSAFVIQNL